MRRFLIIGAGPGAAELLTGYAKEALSGAEMAFATSRLAALLPDVTACPYDKLSERAIQCGAATVALLVSGDVGFYSAAGQLVNELSPHGETELICGLSSLQYFCAKTGISYDNLCIRSLHGREGSILGAVSYHRRVFVLTGGRHTADSVCRDLCQAGLSHLSVSIGENLGTKAERIDTGTAEALAGQAYQNLSVLLIEHPAAANAHEPIRDAMLLRTNVPMTKEEVRWISVNKLAVQPRETVWDIGAGTGSVSLELARKASDGLVYAVERNPEALTLLQRNRQRLGGYNICPVSGAAPAALSSLPAPDCVFIGGSSGQLQAIISLARQKNPAVRIVIHAVTLETLHAAQTGLQAAGFPSVGIVQIAAARGRPAGPYTMLTAQNPVFILSGGGTN